MAMAMESTKLSAALLLLILSISAASASASDATVYPECGTCPSPKHKIPKGPIPLPPVIGKPPITLPPIIGKPPITLPPVTTLPPVVPLLPPITTLPPVVPLLPPVTTLPPVVPLLPPVTTLPPVIPLLPPVTTLPPVIGGKPGAPVTGGCPPPPTPMETCPIDTLKLGACLNVLGQTVHLGDPAVTCCPLVEGIGGVAAAACLCTTIKANLLDLNFFLPIALRLLVTCGNPAPPGYTCPGM